MKNNNYWKQYPVAANADEIEKCISKEIFLSENKQYELLSMKHPANDSCLLISMGSGGHAYVFAELAYFIYKAYLAWHEVIDKDFKSHDIEKKLVSTYDRDPDFDKSYPLKAVMSLVNTPPPDLPEKLNTPTLFIWAKRGLIPAYFKNLFSRLTMKQKELEEVDGGVFWMLSNPKSAAEIITKWINKFS